MTEKIECVLCGKELKGKYKEVSCKELNYGHGDNCECYFPIGLDCYKSINNKRKYKLELQSYDRSILAIVLPIINELMIENNGIEVIQ